MTTYEDLVRSYRFPDRRRITLAPITNVDQSPSGAGLDFADTVRAEPS